MRSRAIPDIVSPGGGEHRVQPIDLSIARVIFHRVPQPQGSPATGLQLSDAESPVEPEHICYLEERMKSSLTSIYSWEVRLDLSSRSPIPRLIEAYLRNPSQDSFIHISQECARHLYSCQDRRNTEGMLCAVDCTFDGCQAFALVKFESEDGIRAHAKNLNGKLVFVVEMLRDLLATKKARVLKVGLFWLKDGEIHGLASDHQRSRGSRTEVARFFIDHFLGARLLMDPTVATKRFIEVTCDFINTSIVDNDLKVRIYGHLVSTLEDAAPIIDPQGFAEDKMPEAYRGSYLGCLEAASVPLSVFDKDREVITQMVGSMRFQFESHLLLVGPPKAFKEKVRVEQTEDGLIRTVIEDRLRKVGK